MFDYLNNLELEIKEKRTHDTKHFLHSAEQGQFICIQSSGLLHAYTNKGFEDINNELPNYKFPVGKEIIEKETKSFIMDLPKWGDAKVEKDGLELAIYDKKGVSIYRYKNPIVVKKGDNPYKVINLEDGFLIKETKNEFEKVEIGEKIVKSDKAIDAKFIAENGKMYFEIPEMPSYPLEVYDATDVGSTDNADNFMYSGANANTNFGAETYTGVGSVWNATQQRTIMKWTLTSGSGTISTIRFYNKVETLVGACIVNLHELTRTTWTEAGSTWNKYNGIDNWTTAGGDYSATIVDTRTAAATGNWFYFNLTTGATNPIAGLTWGSVVHLLQKRTTEDSTDNRYNGYSKESAFDPYLEITYTAGGTVKPKTLSSLGAGS